MKLWTNNKFSVHWTVGTAAVVVADTADEAADYLNHFLAEAWLGPCEAGQFEQMPFVDGEVRILNDGDY